ncbi:MAG TPA: DUF4292 domain-containing protein [Bacteroidales bacterium]|nr:DUF4292 domain-containing protein [Bacteroidales bacterium]HNS45951.1 DUF4292 domain-containing protein [Bacteroidales bacterium]
MVCSHLEWLNRLGFGVLLLACLAGFTSCGTSRKAARKPLKEESPSFLLQKLAENELSYETLSAKFNATYDDGKATVSLTGHLRMKCDSIIWLSLSPALGIEMMRVVLTRDSLKILDRIQSAGLLREYGYIHHLVNGMLDFEMLQSLIVGNDFPGFEQGTVHTATGGDHYKIGFHGRSKKSDAPSGPDSVLFIPSQDVWLSPENFKIIYMSFREQSGEDRTAEAGFNAFKLTGNQLFPYQVTYVIREGDTRLKVDVRYMRVTLNESLNYPFSIPERFIRAKK